MVKRRLMVAIAGVLAVAALVVPAASGGKPTFERITVSDTSPDEFLTEACGVPVTTHEEGEIIIRAFDRAGTGVLFLVNINIRLTATAGDNTYRFKDVGVDKVRRAPNGDEIMMIVGQIPFGFKGALKINLTRGEVIHEPRRDVEEKMIEEACAALTA